MRTFSLIVCSSIGFLEVLYRGDNSIQPIITCILLTSYIVAVIEGILLLLSPDKIIKKPENNPNTPSGTINNGDVVKNGQLSPVFAIVSMLSTGVSLFIAIGITFFHFSGTIMMGEFVLTPITWIFGFLGLRSKYKKIAATSLYISLVKAIIFLALLFGSLAAYNSSH